MSLSTKDTMIRAAILLGLFAIVSTGLVIITFENTREQIIQSEKQFILKNLHAIINPDEHDNDLFADTIVIADIRYLNSPDALTVYRARNQGQPVAALFTTRAPDGYSGTIKILVGIYSNGTLAGVRIISHQETPGLGDAIEENKSDWIYSFNGKSLQNFPQSNWRVKKDGGQFDQFTGATITPRAVVKAVQNTLHYFEINKGMLFSTDSKQNDNK